jgi:hypothetical protein
MTETWENFGGARSLPNRPTVRAPVFNRLESIEIHDEPETLNRQEVRRAYDKLDEADRKFVSEAARGIVALVKEHDTLTAFDFDDALELLSKLGLYLISLPSIQRSKPC